MGLSVPSKFKGCFKQPRKIIGRTINACLLQAIDSKEWEEKGLNFNQVRQSKD